MSLVKIAIICGGPSEERGVSLNSARSFLDHTSSLGVDILPFYRNLKGEFYLLTQGQLYSNTPSDFDFKLQNFSPPLDEKSFIQHLKCVDLVFPIIHGIYGEDGTLQELLEKHGIPFVGSSSEVCKVIFNKHTARKTLEKEGHAVFPSLLITREEREIDDFWQKHKLDRAIIKPTESGSSIGVTYIHEKSQIDIAIQALWKRGFSELLLEPYLEDREFTVCVVENRKGSPVSMIPLEIELLSKQDRILDYRKKYLPSDQIRYHCPPRFTEEEIQNIRKMAEKLFRDLGLRDFARIDGWISKEGKIYFSDFNPISGMEQNSFLFQQVAQIGLSHTDFFAHLLQNVLSRYKIQKTISLQGDTTKEKEKVYVLMGGATAERQVSLMSGTNVWLKLLQHPNYEATPFLLDTKGNIWELPYAYTLHHTVDEVEERCLHAKERTFMHLSLVNEIRKNLELDLMDNLPIPMFFSFSSFIERAKKEEAFVFIALHGGIGEDGTIQKRLEDEGIVFNGSDAITSSLCMDKHQTALCIESMKDPTILSMPQISIPLSFLEKKEKELWERAVLQFQTEDLLIKPQCDGCSAGVARIASLQDLTQYFSHLRSQSKFIPPYTLMHQEALIEMPLSLEHPFLLEPFIHTDRISIVEGSLQYEKTTGWCEITLAIFEKQGKYTALNPSITIAKNYTLSLEEKFQGGTGVNLTPPPEMIISLPVLHKIQEKACKVAEKLGIRNYVRLDLFVHTLTGHIRVIEANTLPALTPSTVLYHQAITLSPPIFPKEVLAKFIQDAKEQTEIYAV